MSQQHAQGDLLTAGIVCRKIPHDRRDRHLQVEQAALVEDHGHGGRGHNFGQGSEIEDAAGRCLGRLRVISKAAESPQAHKLPFMCNGYRSRRESMLDDGVSQQVKWPGENRVLSLISESRGMRRRSSRSIRWELVRQRGLGFDVAVIAKFAEWVKITG